MKNQKELEKLVDETLSSIDSLQAVEPKAFLFTRIQSRMARRDEAATIQNRVSMYRLAAVLVCSLFINIISYQAYLKTQRSDYKPAPNAALAAAYHLEETFYTY